MTSKIGRPTHERKEHRESFRLSDSDMKKIQYCMEETGMSKTDIIRRGVDLVYEEITNKK